MANVHGWLGVHMAKLLHGLIFNSFAYIFSFITAHFCICVLCTVGYYNLMLLEPHGPIRVANLCFCRPQPDTSLYAKSSEITDTGMLHCVLCPFTPQLSPVLILPTDEMMAWLRGPEWQNERTPESVYLAIKPNLMTPRCYPLIL